MNYWFGNRLVNTDPIQRVSVMITHLAWRKVVLLEAIKETNMNVITLKNSTHWLIISRMYQ